MKIVVLAGGLSTERDVSLSSGAGICKTLRERGHEAFLLDVYLGFPYDSNKLEEVFSLPNAGLEIAEGIKTTEPDLAAVKASREDQSDCFVGPNYDTGDIESGIERITYIVPPYTNRNIESINDKIMQLAKNREQLAKVWEDTTSVNAKTIIETQVDKEVKIPAFTFNNVLMLFLVSSLSGVTISGAARILSQGIHNEISLIGGILLTIATLAFVSRIYRLIEFICKHISPSKSFISISKAILNSFKGLGLIHDGAVLSVKEDQYKIFTNIAIKNAKEFIWRLPAMILL